METASALLLTLLAACTGLNGNPPMSYCAKCRVDAAKVRELHGKCGDVDRERFEAESKRVSMLYKEPMTDKQREEVTALHNANTQHHHEQAVECRKSLIKETDEEALNRCFAEWKPPVKAAVPIKK